MAFFFLFSSTLVVEMEGIMACLVSLLLLPTAQVHLFNIAEHASLISVSQLPPRQRPPQNDLQIPELCACLFLLR